jgi:hypothetical protein
VLPNQIEGNFKTIHTLSYDRLTILVQNPNRKLPVPLPFKASNHKLHQGSTSCPPYVLMKFTVAGSGLFFHLLEV